MTIKLYTGDALACLAKLPDESVQCVVTSPPYWGLRDYGTAAWQGGDPGCDHSPRAHGADDKSNGTGALRDKPSLVCKCGARRIDAQLGLEPTPEAYVARMVAVFREVKRVLRDDGTVFLNIGDSYAGGGGYSPDAPSNRNGSISSGGAGKGGAKTKGVRVPCGLKTKDLVGIPWMLAFALRGLGFYLRSDIIWHKPNPMPESVRDRPTKSHEYVFLLTKRARYYYDANAIREEHSGYFRARANEYQSFAPPGQNPHGGLHRCHHSGRNSRSVWTITPKPFKGAHFATFPPALVERCVKAGTSERGACPTCGAPWERVTEPTAEYAAKLASTTEAWYQRKDNPFKGTGRKAGNPGKGICAAYHTLGWRPTCSCGTERPLSQEELEADPSLLDGFEVEPFPPVPCVVLDPFSGAGTVALVSKQLGRDAIGIDLNPAYNAMARKRIAAVSVPELATHH